MFKIIDYEDGFIAYYVEDNVVIAAEVFANMEEALNFKKTLDKDL